MSSPEQNVAEPTTGEILKQLREESKLSVKDIAERMRLDPQLIESLEANDLDALPDAIYIRGYIRSYAKIIEADADSLVALFDNDAPEPPEIIPEIRHSTQASSNDKPVKAFTYLITLALALLLLIWIQSKFVLEDTINYADDPIKASAGTLDYEIVIVKHPQAPSYQDTHNADAKLDDWQVKDNDNAGSSLTLAADNKLQFTESAAITGSDTLALKLSADSWIEIYDANNYKLYLGLARTGDEISLRGNAPFSVKLGFSQGVSLQFNGKEFDPAPFSHAGVARFILGEEQAGDRQQ